MSEIAGHGGNELNDHLSILAIDDLGPGGAHHSYLITSRQGPVSCQINFQRGPVEEFGINGVSNEALLAIVANRLISFQSGPYACPENESALLSVQSALAELHSRTAKRVKRGVEGTSQL